MSYTDEIRLEQGDFVLVRDGISTPLICQELHLALLANMERFISGDISAVAYEAIYLQHLAIEQRARDVREAERRSHRPFSQASSKSARAGKT